MGKNGDARKGSRVQEQSPQRAERSGFQSTSGAGCRGWGGVGGRAPPPQARGAPMVGAQLHRLSRSRKLRAFLLIASNSWLSIPWEGQGQRPCTESHCPGLRILRSGSLECWGSDGRGRQCRVPRCDMWLWTGDTGCPAVCAAIFTVSGSSHCCCYAHFSLAESMS